MELLNIEFTDGIRQYRVLEYIERFKMYRLRNYTDNRENELMKTEQIENYINNIEYYNERFNKNLQRQKEYEIQKLRELEEERKQLEQYNFCYNYTDNKTTLQKAKILKILNEQVLYNNEFYTRKDLIHKLINKDSYTKEYFNTNRYSKKKIEGEYKKLVNKLEYRFYYNKDSVLLEVTKTEYEYINYLIDNLLYSKIK
ncbi:hypothetical protein [Clostridium sp.]|uniref:hypothetical protein n=1 Tax=Clostridium sp. TaxID=1506 RepID=UPI001DB2EE31|nr:hypothetical protein [Clostridium sp.]MBS5307741.1 hypothetical protein [Clostridium sp.]